MSFPKNLRMLRHRFNLHQDDIAAIAGVTKKAVSAWENGTRQPKMGIVQLIANHFNLTVGNLIEEDGMSLERIVEIRNGDEGLDLVDLIKRTEKIHINGKVLSDDHRKVLIDFITVITR